VSAAVSATHSPGAPVLTLTAPGGNVAPIVTALQTWVTETDGELCEARLVIALAVIERLGEQIAAETAVLRHPSAAPHVGSHPRIVRGGM
jgi:hypothetical protein